MSKELNFKLMFGLKLSEEMPEQLRTSLGDYLEEAVKKHVEPGLDNIVNISDIKSNKISLVYLPVNHYLLFFSNLFHDKFYCYYQLYCIF